MNYYYKKINLSTNLCINTYNISFSENDYNNIIYIDNFIRSRSNTLFYNYVKNPLFNINNKEKQKNKLKIYKSIGSDLQFCLLKNNIDYKIIAKCCGFFYNTYIDLDSIILQEYYKFIDQYEKKNIKYPLYQTFIPSRPMNMLKQKNTTKLEDYFN